MKIYKQSDTIEEGDIVEMTVFEPFLHPRTMAATRRKKGQPCRGQCDLHNGSRCNGFCYRYANDDIVFKDTVPPPDYTVVETPYAAYIRQEAANKDNNNN